MLNLNSTFISMKNLSKLMFLSEVFALFLFTQMNVTLHKQTRGNVIFISNFHYGSIYRLQPGQEHSVQTYNKEMPIRH